MWRGWWQDCDRRRTLGSSADLQGYLSTLENLFCAMFFCWSFIILHHEYQSTIIQVCQERDDYTVSAVLSFPALHIHLKRRHLCRQVRLRHPHAHDPQLLHPHLLRQVRRTFEPVSPKETFFFRIFCDITYTVTSCTENEAGRYGR